MTRRLGETLAGGPRGGAGSHPPNAGAGVREGLGAVGYAVLRWVLKGILMLCFRLKVTGAAHLPARGPVILAANHPSQMDPVVLGAAIPRRFTFLAAAELLTMPVLGPLVRPFHPVPVHRGRFDLRAIKDCLQHLRRGDALLIFPEGQISRDGRLNPPHEGLSFLAQRAGVPVIPIGIKGTYQVWPLGTRMPRHGTITVEIGPAIVPGRESGPAPQAALTARVMTAIATLAGEPWTQETAGAPLRHAG